MYSCRRFLRTKADVFHPGFRKKIKSDKTEGKAQAGESGGGERERQGLNPQTHLTEAVVGCFYQDTLTEFLSSAR